MPHAFGRIVLALTVPACLLFAPSVTSAGDPTAIGVLVPWYGDGDAEGWHNWAAMGHDPNQIVDGRRDIASAHYPLMGPYKSHDDNTENWQLAYAEAMGLDVLLIDYYTQNLPGKSVYYDYTVDMLDKAGGSELKIAMQYEPKIHTQNWVRNYNGDRAAMVAAVKDDLRHIYDVLAAKPSYWRVDGKPVVRLFGQTWTLTAAEWSDVVSTLNTEGRELYYMGDAVGGGDLANWYPQFQSHLNWSLYYESIEGAQGWDANYGFAHSVNSQPLNWASAGANRQAVGIAWPGFDDSGVDGWGSGTRFVDRDNGSFYRASLSALNDLNHEWRVFTTLNDWNEGTELEPSFEYGYQYALQTLKHIEAWKGIDLDDDALQDVTETYFPNLVSLWDHGNDLSVLNASASVAVDAANPEAFDGDAGRFRRDGEGSAYIQYVLADDIGGFRISGWSESDAPQSHMLFFSSADGINWTALTPTVTDKGGDAWTRYLYKSDGSLPVGHRYLRIQWPQTDGPNDVTQIGEVKLYDTEMMPIYRLAGDIDGDGYVGLGDLDLVLANWNASVSSEYANVDVSGDGFIGLADLDIVLNQWNMATPPLIGATPEPCSLGLFTCSAGLMLLHR